MTELNNVPALRIKLRKNAIQPCTAVVKTRRQLKKETAHSRSQEIGNMSKILDEGLSPYETFDVRDELRSFHRVHKRFSTGLAVPCLNNAGSRPGVEGCV